MTYAEHQIRFRRLLANYLPDARAEALREMARECALQLILDERRLTIEDLEAHRTRVALRTAAGYVRGQSAPYPVHRCPPELRAELDQTYAYEAVERARFLILEHMNRHRAYGYELALAYFTEANWETVGRRLGIGPSTARRRWARSLNSLRERANHYPDFRKVLE